MRPVWRLSRFIVHPTIVKRVRWAIHQKNFLDTDAPTPPNRRPRSAGPGSSRGPERRIASPDWSQASAGLALRRGHKRRRASPRPPGQKPVEDEVRRAGEGE
jgi:hypothetical protein